jgi:RNA polymerase primary sigma factor
MTQGPDPLKDYLREIAAFPLLSTGEEAELAKLVSAGDGDARRRLIEAHLGLVVAIARRYESGTLHLLALIQEGNIGLMRAVEGYEGASGTRFSSFATSFIRRAIEEALGRAGD